ncbi:MAG: RsmG family class I SAM-dependent methyltransferase [Candidatus Calescibacterium sp.]|nr:class I SAM-dependent methyltransferase [Candidatus Calescibacterium sp.]MDW8132859.1 RsmG family class I SAM-dependent methyltransferase [Candidatus Calescibacterium sp.]
MYNAIIVDSFTQYSILEKIVQNIKKNEIELIDIGTGLGLPSIPIIIATKIINNIPQTIKFHLLEPKQKKVKFLEETRKNLNLDFIIHNADEKFFYSKNKKKFDIVFCRAVFTPPKIFDIFKKYCSHFAFWQYSENYQEILNKYNNKIKQNGLEIFAIFEYNISAKKSYTIILKKT